MTKLLSNSRRPQALAIVIVWGLIWTVLPTNAPAQLPHMTFGQARKIVESAIPYQPVHFAVTHKTLNINGTVLNRVWQKEEQDVALRLSDIKHVDLSDESQGMGNISGFVSLYITGAKKPDYEFKFVRRQDDPAPEHNGRLFWEALQWLVTHASELTPDPSVSQDFKAQAAAWRTASVKPAMPDNAHVHQVLAENAVQEKKFDKAIGEYEAALQIFPTWPEGQFNAALICGETGDYDCAVEHMQDYLELVPNAPNAQAAKDKLIIWKDKLGESQ